MTPLNEAMQQSINLILYICSFEYEKAKEQEKQLEKIRKHK